MLNFLQSPERKMREHAANWLEVASKVWSYRRDVLGEEEARELLGRVAELEGVLRERAEAPRIKQAIDALEAVLARTGGAIYPKTSLTENVEFFLVAALVIIGIRSYFVQPFKIPTNSMWPTYYGITAENLPPGSPAPGAVQRILRAAAFGAERHTVLSPRDGEVSVPLFATREKISVAYTLKDGRKWLIFPARFREYTFYVGGAPATVRVPDDFSELDDVVLGTFFADRAALEAQIHRAALAGQIQEMRVPIDERRGDTYEADLVPTGRSVRAGEPIVRFDLLAGDQLFVDRVSYNFMRPRVGQGFVFRTDHVPDIMRAYGAEYYIKRLAGVPGDTIEIRDPALFRNGAPITGSAAFDLNARQVRPYKGYGNASHDDPRYSLLYKGEPITVPTHSYLALGDNSHNSFDGRFWGYVPEKDVVGRPLFIYYPFTSRWGTAK